MTTMTPAIRPTVQPVRQRARQRVRVRDSQELPPSGVHSTSISSRSSAAPRLGVLSMTRRLPPPTCSLPPRAQGPPRPPHLASSSLPQSVDAAVSVYPATRSLLSLHTNKLALSDKVPRLPVMVVLLLAHRLLASRPPRVLRVPPGNTRSATYPHSQKSKRHWGMPARRPKAWPLARCGGGLRTTWTR